MGISSRYVYEPGNHPPMRNLPVPKANILINHDGRACLADFGLLTIVADQSTTTSSTSCGGTIRWMSPELLFPDSFGLKHSRLTRESDCYALGMVVYEVLSGQMPFALYRNTAVIFKVLHGERPEKPRGAEAAWFTDDLWRMLELCWKHQPGDRISARDVLLCLEGGPLSSLSSVSHVDGGGEWSDAMSSDSSTFPLFRLRLQLTFIHLFGMTGPSISRGLVPPLSRLVIIDTSTASLLHSNSQTHFNRHRGIQVYRLHVVRPNSRPHPIIFLMKQAR